MDEVKEFVLEKMGAKGWRGGGGRLV